MKQSFRLKGLDCANCAAKLERALAKLEGVERASVNFLTCHDGFTLHDLMA